MRAEVLVLHCCQSQALWGRNVHVYVLYSRTLLTVQGHVRSPGAFPPLGPHQVSLRGRGQREGGSNSRKWDEFGAESRFIDVFQCNIITDMRTWPEGAAQSSKTQLWKLNQSAGPTTSSCNDNDSFRSGVHAWAFQCNRTRRHPHSPEQLALTPHLQLVSG